MTATLFGDDVSINRGMLVEWNGVTHRIRAEKARATRILTRRLMLSGPMSQ
jgi:hypothetical protein